MSLGPAEWRSLLRARYGRSPLSRRHSLRARPTDGRIGLRFKRQPGVVAIFPGRSVGAERSGAERSRAAALVEGARRRIATDSTEALDRVATQLRAAGSTEAESLGVTAAFDRNPEALLRYVVAFEVDVPRGAEASPVTHALWMFTADLLAASVPVVPFVLFDIETARVVSLVVTGGMMAVLGIARG